MLKQVEITIFRHIEMETLTLIEMMQSNCTAQSSSMLFDAVKIIIMSWKQKPGTIAITLSYFHTQTILYCRLMLICTRIVYTSNVPALYGRFRSPSVATVVWRSHGHTYCYSPAGGATSAKSYLFANNYRSGGGLVRRDVTPSGPLEANRWVKAGVRERVKALEGGDRQTNTRSVRAL